MKGLYFNGGKESLIILHQHLDEIHAGKVLVFRVKEEEDADFSEMDAYVDRIGALYNIRIVDICGSMQSSICHIKEIHGVTLVSVGLRRSDPGGQFYGTSPYQITDGNWPKMMRYCPLLEWSYGDVWAYIETHKLPVCPLYEAGYTSIGTRHNTFPNHLLFDPETKRFKHAKFLKDYTSERAGRIRHRLPLVEPFAGTIVRGQGNGKKLGFPTANLLETDRCLLPDGIYYGTAHRVSQADCTAEPMVMSVGQNVTFATGTERTVEVHILKTYDADFYGETLTVAVVGFIRPMKKFASLAELVAAIETDIAITINH